MSKRTVEIPKPSVAPARAKPTPTARVIRFFLKRFVHSLLRVKVVGRENLPASGFVAVANHTGWLDGFLLASHMPRKRQVYILGDPTSMQKMHVWPLLRRAGTLIPVDRRNHGDLDLRRHVTACMQAGGSLLLFPEGRFLRLPGESPDDLLPFKKGAAHFAKEAGVPVVPVAVNNNRRLWWLKKVEIRFGFPIDGTNMTAEEFAQAQFDAVNLLRHPDAKPSRLPHLMQGLLNLQHKPSDRTIAAATGGGAGVVEPAPVVEAAHAVEAELSA